MSAYAALMTGKGTGAIATIQICGDSAKDILKNIFKPATDFAVGKILVGTIADGSRTIDQVTIGCEGEDTFAINCHGNPLIVEQIMQLLQKQGVELETSEQLLIRTFKGSNTITLEAKLMLPKAKTIEGTKIILNQIDSGPEPEGFRAGLTAAAKKWLKWPLSQIVSEAKNIIEASKIAKHIIFGCRIVLAGPANTGKSTLLNQLCGKQKAIVTNIKGTTRDWVSANCRIGPLAVELFDTAGLDESPADTIDKASQQAAADIINQADLILLVLDNSGSTEQLTPCLIESIAGKQVLNVLNKSDLPCRFKSDNLSNIVNISAKSGTGIDRLCDEIQRLAGVENFDFSQPVCFTSRQERLLTRLAEAKSKDNAQSIIAELLSGPPNV